MSESEVIETIEEAVELPIEVICTGECLSLSGRSTLTFVIGRHTDDGTLCLALTRNSGGGMFAEDWCNAAEIERIALAEPQLKAKHFNELFPGRSTNSGGFLLSVLKALGLVRNQEETPRFHECVPGATFQSVTAGYMAQAQAVKPESGGRKSLRLKPKEN